MDWQAVTHPVGPLPARTYWLRRALVVAGAVLVLVLLAVLAGAGGGSGGSRSAQSAPRVPVTPSVVSAAPTAAASHSGAVAHTACPQLTVGLSADAASYPSGSAPRFTVTVSNPGPTSCLVDLGTPGRAVTVRSGADRVWSSVDCIPAAAQPVTLAPGQKQSSPDYWSRHRSDPAACSAAGAAATPGTYTAVASAGGVSSAPVSFTLS